MQLGTLFAVDTADASSQSSKQQDETDLHRRAFLISSVHFHTFPTKSDFVKVAKVLKLRTVVDNVLPSRSLTVKWINLPVA